MFLTTLTLFEDCAFCDLVEKNREKQNQNVKRFRKAIGPVGNFEYQCRFHIPENDPGMLKKKIRMTFWNLNFSNFSKSNLKTNHEIKGDAKKSRRLSKNELRVAIFLTFFDQNDLISIFSKILLF